jgi:hypothetical protein
MLTAILKFFVAQFMVFWKKWMVNRKIEREADSALEEARKRRDDRRADTRDARDKLLDQIRNIGGV